MTADHRRRPTEPRRRRDVLQMIGLVAIGGAAGVALPVAAPTADAYDPGREETRTRYKADSPDVQAFYRTNRYETE